MRPIRWVKEGWALVGADLPVFTLAAFITISLTLLSAFILGLPLLVGMAIMFLEKQQGNSPTLAHLWEGFSRFSAAIVLWILYLLAGLPFMVGNAWLAYGDGGSNWGILLETAGHVLLAAPLLLALPLIADRDLSARDALRLSLLGMRSRWGELLLATIIYTAMVLLGVVACLVGVLLTLPVVVGAMVLAYRELAGDLERPQLTSLISPEGDEGGEGGERGWVRWHRKRYHKTPGANDSSSSKAGSCSSHDSEYPDGEGSDHGDENDNNYQTIRGEIGHESFSQLFTEALQPADGDIGSTADDGEADRPGDSGGIDGGGADRPDQPGASG